VKRGEESCWERGGSGGEEGEKSGMGGGGRKSVASKYVWYGTFL